jgi:hypothetical protein
LLCVAGSKAQEEDGMLFNRRMKVRKKATRLRVAQKRE